MTKNKLPDDSSFQFDRFKKRSNAEQFRKFGINPAAMEDLALLQQRHNLYPENLEQAKAHNQNWAFELDQRLTELTGYSLQSQELCEVADTLASSEAQIERYERISSRLALLEKEKKETIFRLTRAGAKQLLPWLPVAALIILSAVIYNQSNGNRTQNSSTGPSQLQQQPGSTGSANREEAPVSKPTGETK
jgi:hypothetical protein